MIGIPSWAVRGAKCVYVGGEWSAAQNGIYDPEGQLTYPTTGEVYTIREVRIRMVPEWGNEVMTGVLVEEIRNPESTGGSGAGSEMAFWVGDFRPLATVASDVEAHFRQHLDVREPVEA